MKRNKRDPPQCGREGVINFRMESPISSYLILPYSVKVKVTSQTAARGKIGPKNRDENDVTRKVSERNGVERGRYVGLELTPAEAGNRSGSIE
jgi:hypothetical protein